MEDEEVEVTNYEDEHGQWVIGNIIVADASSEAEAIAMLEAANAAPDAELDAT